MKKRFILLLAAVMTFSLLFAACAPAETGGEEPAQIGEEPTEEMAQPTEEMAQPTEEMAAEQPTEEMMQVGPITVGSKDFTEQLILGSMTVQLLEANGYQVDDQTGLGGTTVNREALEAGEIDVYWEYTGTALVNFLGVEDVITDPQEAYDRAKEADAANGLTWLAPADFNNTYTLMVTQDTVDAGITTISDLAAAMRDDPTSFRLCTNAEFYARPDGFKGVEALYDFTFPEDGVIAMDSGLTYQALRDGECEVAMGFATDGRIAAFNFTNLEDDLGFFPTYNPAPVIRQEVLDADMGIGVVLNLLGATLDTATMTELNKRVDIDEEDVATVACDHLLSNGLVDSCE
jgi:osmoprotectant transport system substrate-binding protein